MKMRRGRTHRPSRPSEQRGRSAAERLARERAEHRRLGIKWYWRMVWCSVLYLAFAVIPALVFRLALETESREAAGAAMVFAFMVYWVIFPILTIVSIVAFFLCVYHVVHK